MVTIDRLHTKMSHTGIDTSELFQMMVMLQNAGASFSDKNDIVKILGQLIRKTHLQFIREENLFEQFAYPEAARHKEDHRSFIQEMDMLYLDFIGCKTSCALNIADQLLCLIEDHALRFDSGFASFLEHKHSATEYAVEL